MKIMLVVTILTSGSGYFVRKQTLPYVLPVGTEVNFKIGTIRCSEKIDSLDYDMDTSTVSMWVFCDRVVDVNTLIEDNLLLTSDEAWVQK